MIFDFNLCEYTDLIEHDLKTKAIFDYSDLLEEARDMIEEKNMLEGKKED